MKKYSKVCLSLILFVLIIVGQAIVSYSKADALTVSLKPNLNSSAYNNDNIFTNCGYKGECTWFTYGRVLEKLHIKLSSAFYGNATDWWGSNINNQIYNYGYEPKADSIIVWNGGKYGYGHVGYVEKVEGNLVYFNEGNYSVKGNYEGNIKVMTKEAIKNRGNIFLTGYIYVKEKYTAKNSTTTSYGQVTLGDDSSYLNVRTGAGASFAKIGVLKNKAKVTILGKVSNWYKIQFNNSIGYVCADYISKTVSNTVNNNVSNNTNKTFIGKVNLSGSNSCLNVRKGAGSSFAVIGTLPNKTQVTVLSQTGNWYKINFKNSIGYVCADYISKIVSNSSSTATNKNTNSTVNNTLTGKVNLSDNSSCLNVRKGAGSSFAVMGILHNKTQVVILGKTGNWYKIKFNNSTGYVCADYILK